MVSLSCGGPVFAHDSQLARFHGSSERYLNSLGVFYDKLPGLDSPEFGNPAGGFGDSFGGFGNLFGGF